MEEDNRRKGISVKDIVISGAIVTALFLVSYITAQSASDRNMAAGIVLFGLLALGVSVLLGILDLIRRYLNVRRTALKALGKHGIRMVRKDEGARYAYKGLVKLINSRLPEAEELLMKALSVSDIRQNQIFCLEWLIKIYSAQENDAQLMWCMRRAAEISPDNPEIQSRLGHAYYSEGRLANAEHCFEQALKYDPNHGYSYYSLAQIYLIRGEDERALETLNKLVTIQQNHPLVYAELAIYHAMHDNEELCRENYDKAIMCGYHEPEKLSERITAIKQFNNAENAAGEDLPHEYYRRIEKEDTDAGNV